MFHEPHALNAGTNIAGYEIVRVLGTGGFGITYEADSPFTAKRVAIKEFFPRGIASREGDGRIAFAERDAEVVRWALKRFESSTLDQCKLKHPNIVDVVHYVKDNGTGYMIMEYVEGQTLEAWLRESDLPPASAELRPLIEPVFSALEYLHAQNMIHRDIAPDNIMIRADGTPVVIDFGAIKLIEQQTQIRSQAEQSFVVAKQFYSPPEQIQENGELDERADIYALGAVLYRAFSGRPPASAEERMQKLAFRKPDPILPLADVAAALDFDIADAIDVALAFDAEDRHRTVSDFRDALGWHDAWSSTTLSISSDRAHPQEASGHVPLRKSRLPWILPLAGIVIVAAFIAFSVVIIPWAEKRAQPVEITPPKMDTIVVPPQTPVFTPPAPAVQPEPDRQEPADEPEPDPNRR
jgi:serine/threonine protein kinase